MQPRSRTRRFALAVGLGLGLAGLGLPVTSAVAAIGGGTPTVIDSFATNQSALTLTFPPAGTEAASGVSGAGLLGGERDLTVALQGGVIAGNTLSANVSSGLFNYSQDATISGQARLTWDGADGGSPMIATTGLGGIDLTAGGSQDALDLSVQLDTLPLLVSVTVFSDTTHVSSAAVALPGLLAANRDYVIPFSSFAPLFGAGADLTNVGAIHMTVGSTNAAPVLVLGALTTDALLKAPMTAALTGDVNGNGLAEAGDELTYTTTISNPADANAAASPGTTFAFDPPAGTRLVAGSVTTSAGTVTGGNGSGDTAAAVAVGTLADGATATVTAKVEVGVHPTSPLSAQGTVSSSSLTALKTDDPSVSGTTDPTTLAVVENRAPTATDDDATVVGGTRLTVAAPGVLANDDDPDGDPLTAAVETGPAHGQLTLAADGGYRYAPEAGFTGTDSFTYVASDGTASSAPATVTITVTAPPTTTVPVVPAADTTGGSGPLPAPPLVPPATAPPAPAPKPTCVSRRSVRITLPRAVRGAKRATVGVSGRKARSVPVRNGRVTVDLSGAPRGKYTVRIRVGKRTVVVRDYRTCRRPSESRG